jgi:hypothetical protein
VTQPTHTAYETATRRAVALGSLSAVLDAIANPVGEEEAAWALEEHGQCDTGVYTIVEADTNPDAVDWTWATQRTEAQKTAAAVRVLLETTALDGNAFERAVEAIAGRHLDEAAAWVREYNETGEEWVEQDVQRLLAALA